jgi:hypothetical protein
VSIRFACVHCLGSPGAREALEEALRREGAQPIESVADWAGDGIVESDDELDEFLDSRAPLNKRKSP